MAGLMAGRGQDAVAGRGRRLLRASLGVALLVAGAAPAGAHGGARATAPALLAAVPPDGALLAQAPRAVRLTFTAPLSPQRSHIEVVSDAMTLVNGASTVVGAHHERLVSPLRALSPGLYAVIWTAAGAPSAPNAQSAPRRQAYVFTVAPLGPPLLPDRPVALTHHLGTLVVGFAVPSDRVGRHIDTVTLRARGRPLAGATVLLVGRSLDMNMGQVPAATRAIGGGRYAGAADVVMAGDWQVAVAVRDGRTSARTTFTYVAHY